jgi:hypothetical protein
VIVAYPADAGPDARAEIDRLREQIATLTEILRLRGNQINLLEKMNEQKRGIIGCVAAQAWERGTRFDLRGCV